MKLAAIVFFGLLFYAHRAGGLDQPLGRPLCDFRDGDAKVLGYALFCMIAIVGALYTITVKRFEKSDAPLNTMGFGVLLLVVVATPSPWPLHAASAIILLGSIYLYFAVVLYRSGRTWLWALYLAVPLALGIATSFHYGIWQKLMICYFVLAAVIHDHVLKTSSTSKYCAMQI